MPNPNRFGELVTQVVDDYRYIKGMHLLDEAQALIENEIGISAETLRKWRGGKRVARQRQDLHAFVKLMAEAGVKMDRAWVIEIFEAAGMESYAGETLAALGMLQPIDSGARPDRPVLTPAAAPVNELATGQPTSPLESTTPVDARRRRRWPLFGLGLMVVIMISGVIILNGRNAIPIEPPGPTDTGLSTPTTGLPVATKAVVAPRPTPGATTTILAAPDSPVSPTLLAVNVSHTEGRSDYPQLVADRAGQVHLIWNDNSQRSGGDFFYRQATATGDWAATARSLTDDFEQVAPFARVIQQPDGQPCLVWFGSPVTSDLGRYGLYQRCLKGDQWSKASLVLHQTIRPHYFQPAFTSDGQMRLAYLTSSGQIKVGEQTLTAPYRLTANLAFVIDQAGGYHVAWIDATDLKSAVIVYRYSSNGGDTWTEPQTLSDQQSVPVLDLVMAADSKGRVHLTWDNAGIFYRRWSPQTGWEPTVELSGSAETAAGVQLAIDAAAVPHVMWQGSIAKPDIYYAFQQPGDNWTEPRRIAHVEHADDAQLALAVSPQGTKHFAWQGGDNDIYYATVP